MSGANTGEGGAALVVKGQHLGGGGGVCIGCEGPTPGGGGGGGCTGCEGPTPGGWGLHWLSRANTGGGAALVVKGHHLEGVVWGWRSGGCTGCQEPSPGGGGGALAVEGWHRGGCVGVGVRGLHWLSRAISVMEVYGAQCSAKPRSFDLLTDLEPHS